MNKTGSSSCVSFIVTDPRDGRVVGIVIEDEAGATGVAIVGTKPVVAGRFAVRSSVIDRIGVLAKPPKRAVARSLITQRIDAEIEVRWL